MKHKHFKNPIGTRTVADEVGRGEGEVLSCKTFNTKIRNISFINPIQFHDKENEACGEEEIKQTREICSPLGLFSFLGGFVSNQ